MNSDEYDSRDHTQRLELEFDAALLRSLDPQQLIADCLRCLKPLRSRRTEIYTVVTELFCNALEHGLLQLDSALKRNGDGFGDYYRERLRRLGALEHGWIRVAIEFTGTVEQGELRIRVSDSGNGFDHQSAQSTMPPQDRFFHRGLSLVQGLCESLKHLGAGNIVEAVYVWGGD